MRGKSLSLLTFLLHKLPLIESTSALSASENIWSKEVCCTSINNPIAYFDSFLIKSITSMDGLKASDKISILTQRHFSAKIITYNHLKLLPMT
jgi:hypothetical protein